MKMTPEQRRKSAEGAELMARVLRHAADGAEIVRDGIQRDSLPVARLTETLDAMSSSLAEVRASIEDLKRLLIAIDERERETPQ